MEEYWLQWNNHESVLSQVACNLLSNGALVDCTLAVEGHFLNVHRLILCACSPYFESLLSQQLDKHPIIILKDVTFAELKLLIDYMYKGKVSTSIQDLAGFVKAAQSLQIKGLSREENEQFINNTKASTSNCSKTSDTEANETVEPSVESESPSVQPRNRRSKKPTDSEKETNSSLVDVNSSLSKSMDVVIVESEDTVTVPPANTDLDCDSAMAVDLTQDDDEETVFSSGASKDAVSVDDQPEIEVMENGKIDDMESERIDVTVTEFNLGTGTLRRKGPKRRSRRSKTLPKIEEKVSNEDNLDASPVKNSEEKVESNPIDEKNMNDDLTNEKSMESDVMEKTTPENTETNMRVTRSGARMSYTPKKKRSSKNTTNESGSLEPTNKKSVTTRVRSQPTNVSRLRGRRKEPLEEDLEAESLATQIPNGEMQAIDNEPNEMQAIDNEPNEINNEELDDDRTKNEKDIEILGLNDVNDCNRINDDSLDHNNHNGINEEVDPGRSQVYDLNENERTLVEVSNESEEMSTEISKEDQKKRRKRRKTSSWARQQLQPRKKSKYQRRSLSLPPQHLYTSKPNEEDTAEFVVETKTSVECLSLTS